MAGASVFATSCGVSADFSDFFRSRALALSETIALRLKCTPTLKVMECPNRKNNVLVSDWDKLNQKFSESKMIVNSLPRLKLPKVFQEEVHNKMSILRDRRIPSIRFIVFINVKLKCLQTVIY